MKYRVLKFSTIALLTVCLTACATDSYNSDSNSDNVSEPQQSAQSNVIEESLGTIEIDGMEFRLPCSYAALTIYPTQDEAEWFPPEESNYADGMYEQMISFRVNKDSNHSYSLRCAYPDGESYKSGTIYSVLHNVDGATLTYYGEEFVCGETTKEELVGKLGTQYTLSTTGAYIYTYQDGNVVAVFLDDTLTFITVTAVEGTE